MTKPTSDLPAMVGTFTRAAASSANSWNEEERTVAVVMSTGAAVERRSYAEGPFIEVLEISAEAVDLSRCDGMSVLDSHSPYSIQSRLGTVVPGSVRIVAGALVGVVKLSRNELGESLAQDLRDGHLFSVSVGYAIKEYRWDEGDADAVPTLTATKWLPLELSAVCIPADAQAKSRNLETSMSQTTTSAPGHLPAPTADPALTERNRAAEIRALGARVSGIDAALVERAVNEGMTVAAFRSAAFDAIVDRQDQAPSYPHMPIRTGRSNTDEALAGLTEVLSGRAARSGVAVARQYLAGNGVDVRSLGDRDVARAVMGGSSIWAGGQRAMHSTSDFAFLVGQAASNVLLERFSANPSVLKAFSRQRNAPDFRDVRFYRPGEGPRLLKVNEHGEIKSGTLSEESNGFRIDSYGRIFALSFQASVNDGLGAFADFLSTFAESATRLEGDLFAHLLDGSGPRLDDGFPLFHETHGNLAATPTELNIGTVSAGVIAMRTQKNVNGDGFAGTAPSALLVGPALELKAKQLVAGIQATNFEQVNPHKLEVIVEDRFGPDFHGWFLLADPARRPAFLHGGLEGQLGPQVDTKDGWEILGTEYRVVHHFGAGVHDHRAIFYNPGIAG